MALDNIGKDLLLLSDFIEINKAYGSDDKKLIKRAELNTLALSFRKGLYDQLRYLDLDGNEVIRINYNNGIPTIVPKNQLQNKQDRYYFQDSLKLKDGEIYISILDLNIEHGKIEQPYKPMIRLVTPIFDEYGEKRGVVILNYLAEYLIDGLKLFSLEQKNHHMLINSDNYFLIYDKRPELEFAFMFGENKDKKYSAIYPKTYKCFKNRQQGQYSIGSGILTFDSVFSYPENLKSDKYVSIINQDTCWRLITFVPSVPLWSLSEMKGNELLIVISLLIFSVIISLLIAQLQLKKIMNNNEINKLAHHDGLTGLINRGYFNKLFHWKMQSARKDNTKLALIYIDLDAFKDLNDNFGHSAGDLALKAIAKNLHNVFSDNAYVARLGGDEFAILIYDLTTHQTVIEQVEKFIKNNNEPLILEDISYHLSTSIGIAFFPEHGGCINEVMHNADAAMYDIKHSGKNGFKIFEL
ncbi:sensor domain-containing diguanylate cyclase [Aliivibrio sp. S4TY2]|uniref:sensor domain-containing diguanylate cyclase n=1 Tax=unclassified Aliivibrio TaxID=2645654 RepID=UPI002379D788|nr:MULTISPECIES: sensor domain-containing diguanylate cyclase [unclassified Aliivibrio]MDD9155089.1 sensor domain-containing diguanylate cyclase [Aliivibrio sp. S4TY2]MDD9159358.1 sensor domain-containing diguanylate cyclase [Aliivibrio sp. S4TY1]MDD9163092.1 sensor domain-containing diguanylate cyclase [Aliivibrio sp. S4MY2]MDD9167358.1 sensor domain-containing diguanylate cyclase [Aliivibrio sp. S4MY4]MDD9184169.1 sensor domain-containing diguanylate cyclase [Aliivibrio sp. S4MY3]